MQYKLGSYCVDLATGRVSSAGAATELSYRARLALELLIQANGGVVRREDLFERLWPQARVDETSLTKCIAQIRGALGNGNEDGGAIETVPRIGYRLRISAEPLPDSTDAPVDPLATGVTAPNRPSPGHRGYLRIATGLAGVLLVAGGTAFALHVQRSWQRAGEAERLFQQASQLLGLRDPDNAATAVRLYGQAIALEPKRAEWYAHLAHAIDRSYVPTDGPQPPAALETARRGVELDPSCLRCRIIYGYLLYRLDWQWEEAERQLRTALRLSPGSSETAANLAMLLPALGRHQEALVLIDSALADRPFNANWHAIRASILYFSGRYQEAVDAANQGIALHRGNYACFDWKSRALVQLNRHGDAVLAMASGPYHDQADAIEAALARGGPPEALRELLRLSGTTLGRRKWMWRRVVWLIQLDRLNEALEELEFGISLRNVNLTWIAVDPAYRPLQSHPRYQQALASLRLTASTTGPGTRRTALPAPPAAER